MGRFDSGQTTGWGEGDFTYDGVVDILDVTEMLSAGLFDTGDYLPASFSPVSVPEPAPIGWLAMVATIAARPSSESARERVGVSLTIHACFMFLIPIEVRQAPPS
ncbi:MAG: hypothetical protein ACKO4T_01725 [Planctomycetaceae bacterium]